MNLRGDGEELLSFQCQRHDNTSHPDSFFLFSIVPVTTVTIVAIVIIVTTVTSINMLPVSFVSGCI